MVSFHCCHKTGCFFLRCLSPTGVVKSVSTLRLIKNDTISNEYYVCCSSEVFKKYLQPIPTDFYSCALGLVLGCFSFRSEG